MQLRNSSFAFGAITKLFHWVNALLIVLMLAVGFIMTDMPDNMDKLRLIGLHKATGIVVLSWATCWVLWRVNNSKPLYPATMLSWQRLAADASKYVLIALLFVMPLSGWAMSSAAGYPVSFFGLFVLPPLVEPNKELGALMAELHELFALAIIAVVCAHVGAALLHHFYYKDNVLRRMLPSSRGDIHVQESDTHTGC